MIVYGVRNFILNTFVFFPSDKDLFPLGHHQHGTRIMHEFLVGKTNTDRTLNELKSTE